MENNGPCGSLELTHGLEAEEGIGLVRAVALKHAQVSEPWAGFWNSKSLDPFTEFLYPLVEG